MAHSRSNPRITHLWPVGMTDPNFVYRARGPTGRLRHEYSKARVVVSALTIGADWSMLLSHLVVVLLGI